MDFVALVRDPLWKDLWEDESVEKKVAALKRALLDSPETDPHRLGKLRGQLDAFTWLQSHVLEMAKAQEKSAGMEPHSEEKKTRIDRLRAWVVR
jgi:acyl carrier protein phosphodiesterase